MTKNLPLLLVITALLVVGILYLYKLTPSSGTPTTPATSQEALDSELNQVDEVTVKTSGEDFVGSDLNASDLGL